MKKIAISVLLLGLGLFANNVSAQFAPDFTPPKSVDSHIFDNWTPPVTTGPAQRGSCFDKKNKKETCAATRYAWDDPYSSYEKWIGNTPKPLDQEMVARFNKFKNDKSEGLDQSVWIGMARAYANAHMWKEAIDLLNQQIKIWYSSPIAYLMRANIATQLGRDDLAGQDLMAAKYWWETASHDYQNHSMREELLYGSLFEWSIRHKQYSEAFDYYAKIPKDTWNAGYDTYLKRYAQVWKNNEPQLKSVEANRKAEANNKLNIQKQAESNAWAAKLGVSEAQLAEIDADIAQLSNECKSTALLEKAVAGNYKKNQTFPRLLEAYEICDKFTEAQKMRDENPNVDGMPYMKFAKPFNTVGWKLSCDQTPVHLESAMKAKYQVFYIGLRLGRFYVNCGRTKEAREAMSPAILSDHSWAESKVWGFNAEANELNFLYAQSYLMDKNIEKAVAWYEILVAFTDKATPAIDDALYMKRLDEAKELLKRADLLGINSNDYKISKTRIEGAYSAFYARKKAVENVPKPPVLTVEDQCYNLAKTVVQDWNGAVAAQKRGGEFPSDDVIANFAHVCNFGEQQLNKAKSMKCSADIIENLEESISMARGASDSLANFVQSETGRYVAHGCF